VTRLGDDVIERFGRIPTSTICDALVRSGIRRPETVFIPNTVPLNKRTIRSAGRARTQRSTIVRDAERSAMVNDRALSFRLVEEAAAGDFLVITAPVGFPYAIFGGSLALVAHRRGVAGVLVDGYTRDTHEIEELGLATWTHGVTAIAGGYGGYSVAEVDVPIVCAGVEVLPGDCVVGDGDGLVIVPASDAERLLPECEAMDADEARSHEALKQGRTMLESYPSRNYYAKPD
jgi:regulator of RNase E activity RraA